jgi:peptidoglycan/LPS O-acetylase OafA/YrhL
VHSSEYSQPLPALFSASLDLMRLIAAMGVFVSHLCRPEYSTALGRYQPFVGDGHEWVVVFLVISGFVVAHSTMSRKIPLVQFAVKRLTRLWSVLLPALAVTAGVEIALRFQSGNSFGWLDEAMVFLARNGLTALFLNEVWFLSAAPALNKPLWSISYEFWFYAFFAAAVFPRKRAAKLAWCGAVLAAAGPKIALLLPCWCSGVFLWSLTRTNAPTVSRPSRIALLASVVLLCVAWSFAPAWRVELFPEAQSLWFSRWFLSDWLISGFLVIALMLLHFETFRRHSSAAASAAGLLRRAADHTFAVYAFHFPLLSLTSAILGQKSTEMLPSILGGVGVLWVCAGAGFLTRSLHRHLLSLASAKTDLIC